MTNDTPSMPLAQAGSRPVLVGVDGSAAGFAAVQWASHEAHVRGVSLHILHVQQSPLRAGDFPASVCERGLVEMVRAARKVVEIARKIRSVYPRLDIRAEIRTGEAVPYLLRATEGASLFVIGTNRRATAGLLRPSLERTMTHFSRTPVVVVPTSAKYVFPAHGGRVLVLSNRRSQLDQVLEHAFAVARRQKLAVRVLMQSPGKHDDPRDQCVVDVERTFDVLARWRAIYTDVHTSGLVVHSGDGETLACEVIRADIVAVGQPGYLSWIRKLNQSARVRSSRHMPHPLLVVPS